MNPIAGPMTFGETLDRIWKIVRQRLWLFVGIGMVPLGALVLMMAAVFAVLFALGDFPQPQAGHDAAKAVLPIFLTMGSLLVPMLAVFAVFQGAACNAALAMSRGLETSWAAAYGAALKNTGRYVWLTGLCWLLVSVPMLVVFALFGLFSLLAGAHSSSGVLFFLFPLLVIGYIGSAVYMVWMMLRVGLAYPAAAAENISAAAALRRSFELTRTGKGRMFLVMLVVYAISYGAMIVAEMVGFAVFGVLGLIGMALDANQHSPVAIFGMVLGGMVGAAAFFIAMALVYAAYAVSLSVLYEDRVLRMDGPPAMSGGVA